MRPLDPEAVLLSGTQLIEASAGTGKTYTITTLFLRLILDGYRIDGILVVTFTEAATAELRDRLRRRLREALTVLQSGEGEETLRNLLDRCVSQTGGSVVERRLQAALSGFDEAAVMTIHGFCRRMLQEHAFESGVLFDAELLTDPSAVYEEIVRDFWALHVYRLPVHWIGLLQETKITPDSLLGLLRQAAEHPDRTILPAVDDSAVAIDSFDRLYGEAKQLWAEGRDEITALLATHPGVYRKSYTKPNLSRWLDNTAEFLSPDAPTRFAGDADLARFTRSKLSETAQQLKTPSPPPSHPFFDVAEALCRFMKIWPIAFQHRFIVEGLALLSERKQTLGIHFFGDLILGLDGALTGPNAELLAERIRNRYPAALIDEFQDTDQAQYRIFRRVYQGTKAPFFLIGDPKQSIYGFRGADVFAYLKAVADVGADVLNLDTNWRSDPALIQGLNTLFDPARVNRPFGFSQIEYVPVNSRPAAVDLLRVNGRSEPALQLLWIERSDEIDISKGLIPKGWMTANLPNRIAGDICRLLSCRTVLSGTPPTPLTPGDVAVLVRTNAQALHIQTALRRIGLACAVTSGESVFQSTEAFELSQVLQAVADPGNDTHIAAALATDLFGLNGNEIHSFREGNSVWEEWGMRFRTWHRLWREKGFSQAVRAMFSFKPVESSPGLLLGLLGLADGERRVTNFQHLSELLHEASVGEHLGPAGLMDWVAARRSGAVSAVDAHELRLESDARAVQAVTIHKSKGLEYPIVYAPYLWDGGHSGKGAIACHDPSDFGRSILDLGSDQWDRHREQARLEEMAENLRLLYVALTRARHSCRVVWAAAKDFDTSALGYLLHRPNAEAGFTDTALHIKDLTDIAIQTDLLSLCTQSGGAIGLRELPPADDLRYRPTQSVPPELHCRSGKRPLQRYWRTESFSHLVADSETVPLPDEEIGIDHDQRPIPPPPHSPTAAGDSSDQDGRIRLADFSRGPEAGLFFHSIYELIDFTEKDPEIRRAAVSDVSSRYGISTDDWLEILCASLEDTLTCPLDPEIPGLRLDQIPNARRLNELAFIFPVSDPMGKSSPRVTAGALADIFSRHAGPRLPERYLSRISKLSFPAIHGYLKGFIDLIFEFEKKWYVVDYKSNYLGESYCRYDPGALSVAMTDHHYFLQYHLYTVALHRYLASRLPDYDYDRDFGGVYYLFIRGMSPKTGPDFGVFRDRPPMPLIEALSKLFG